MADAALSDRRHAALYVLTAGLMFASMGACIKAVAPLVTNEMVVFFRNLLGMLVLLPWLLRSASGGLRTQVPHLHLLRGLAGLAAMYCFFYAIRQLPLAEAVLLNFSAPLFMPLIAWLWLREPVGSAILLAIGVGFVGVILILDPGGTVLSVDGLVGLAAGLFAALAMVTIRRLTRSEPPARIVFYFALTGALVSALPLYWRWQPLSIDAAMLLVLIALFATLGQLLLTRGYALRPAAQVAPFTYSSVVFAALYGLLLWGTVPQIWTLIGGALVVAAGVLAMRAGRGSQ